MWRQGLVPNSNFLSHAWFSHLHNLSGDSSVKSTGKMQKKNFGRTFSSLSPGKKSRTMMIMRLFFHLFPHPGF